MATKKTAAPPQPPKLTALQRWGSVQRKQIDAETLEWLSTVAGGILAAAAEKDANTRRQAVLNATGIAGKVNLNAHLAEVAVWAADQDAIPKTKRRSAQRAMTELVLNLPPGKATDEEREALRKRIERAIARVKKRT